MYISSDSRWTSAAAPGTPSPLRPPPTWTDSWQPTAAAAAAAAATVTGRVSGHTRSRSRNSSWGGSWRADRRTPTRGWLAAAKTRLPRLDNATSLQAQVHTLACEYIITWAGLYTVETWFMSTFSWKKYMTLKVICPQPNYKWLKRIKLSLLCERVIDITHLYPTTIVQALWTPTTLLKLTPSPALYSAALW